MSTPVSPPGRQGRADRRILRIILIFLAVTILPAIAHGNTLTSSWHLHTCSLDDEGGARCWGSNRYGQLGDGSQIDSNSPLQVSGVRDAISLATSRDSSCAVLRNGTIKCWGRNLYGQLGDRTLVDRPQPVDVVGINTALSVAMGNSHSCAILVGGAVTCWGGYANTTCFPTLPCTPPGGPPPAPFVIDGLQGAKQLAIGLSFGCATVENGKVKCFRSPGVLGEPRPGVGEVPGLDDIVDLARADMGMCALRSTGKVRCWRGGVQDSEFILESSIDLMVNDATRFSVGSKRSCAVVTGNKVSCWDFKDFGGYSQSEPVEQVGIAGAADVAVGSDHACARRVDGEIRCWGSNEVGQLGTGETNFDTGPRSIDGVAGAVAVAAADDRTCVLFASGRVSCRGSFTTALVEVPDLSGAVRIAMHGDRGCASLVDGSVKCWSQGSAATAVAGLSGAGAIAMNGETICVTVPEGVRCRSLQNSSNWINDIVAPQSLAVVSYYRACANDYRGVVRCWSPYPGQPAPPGASTSTVFSGIDGVSALAGASLNAEPTFCAISRGTAMCWGNNRYGQLGTGSISYNDSPPSPVVGIGAGQVVSIATHETHSCAVKVDGSVWCWGLNTHGQLGNRTTLDSLSAVRVDGITNATAVTTGARHSCAVLGDGGVSCWGRHPENVATFLPTHVAGSPFVASLQPLPAWLDSDWHETGTFGQALFRDVEGSLKVIAGDRLLLQFDGVTESQQPLRLEGVYHHDAGSIVGKRFVLPVYKQKHSDGIASDAAEQQILWGSAAVTVLDEQRLKITWNPDLGGSQTMNLTRKLFASGFDDVLVVPSP